MNEEVLVDEPCSPFTSIVWEESEGTLVGPFLESRCRCRAVGEDPLPYPHEGMSE